MRLTTSLVVLASLLCLGSCFGGIKFPNITQHYGYLNANTKYGVDLFYWMFESLDKPQTDPFVVWLTGGPGCSSELALFFENGPYKVNKDLTLAFNPFTWNSHANLLFVDQPGGTGFSKVRNSHGYVTNEDQIATDFVTFLTNFFQKYPQYKNLPFYITGESYGGHYVPAIASKIATSTTGINLKAVAIGNGYVDPEIQDGSFGPFLYAHGLIDQDDLNSVQTQYAQCQSDIESKKWDSAFYDCNAVLGMALGYAGNINVYDIREPCKTPPLCYNLQPIADYLDQSYVRQKLGVGDKNWESCNSKVYQYLEKDFEQSYLFDIPILLNKGVRVLLYNGNYDLICNFYGTSQMLNGMQWSGQTSFNNAQNTTWTLNGQTLGNARTASGLTYVVVANAGHMVPYNQPKAALDLLTRFLNNKPFN